LNGACQTGSNLALARNPSTVGWWVRGLVGDSLAKMTMRNHHTDDIANLKFRGCSEWIFGDGPTKPIQGVRLGRNWLNR